MSIALTVPMRLMLTFLFDKALHVPTATAYQKMQKVSDRRKRSVLPMQLAKQMSHIVGLDKSGGSGWIGRSKSFVGEDDHGARRHDGESPQGERAHHGQL